MHGRRYVSPSGQEHMLFQNGLEPIVTLHYEHFRPLPRNIVRLTFAKSPATSVLSTVLSCVPSARDRPPSMDIDDSAEQLPM